MKKYPDGSTFYTTAELVKLLKADHVSLGRYGIWIFPKEAKK
jgi:hypothetical protein